MLKHSSGAKLLDYTHMPTNEELGDALLNAAARGDCKKLRKIIQTGLYVLYMAYQVKIWKLVLCLYVLYIWLIRPIRKLTLCVTIWCISILSI